MCVRACIRILSRCQALQAQPEKQAVPERYVKLGGVRRNEFIFTEATCICGTLRQLRVTREVSFSPRFHRELCRRIKNEIFRDRRCSDISISVAYRALAPRRVFVFLEEIMGHVCIVFDFWNCYQLNSEYRVLQKNVHVVITRNSVSNFNFMSSEVRLNAISVTTFKF